MKSEDWQSADDEVERNERYTIALAIWQDANGLNHLDLTPEQNTRFVAWSASNDVGNGKRLIFGQKRRIAGRMNDGVGG